MLSSYWKNRITKEFRAGEKSIEQMVTDYGHTEKAIKSVLFPDKKNRGTITDAVVKVAPPVRFPVKEGLKIVAGKDPKMIEAGRKAHQTKLENLKKQDTPQPEPKKEEPKEEVKQAKKEEKKEVSVESMRLALKKLEEIPTGGLNRKQRRELSKQQQAMRIELGRKTYTEPNPHDVVEATIANITGNSVSPDRIKRKYNKKPRLVEPIPDIVVPELPSKLVDPIEQAQRMQEAITYMDTILPIEKKETKSANVLAAEHMINSAVTLLMEAIKLLKQ